MKRRYLFLLCSLYSIFLTTEIDGQDSWFKNKSLNQKQTSIKNDFAYQTYCIATNHPDTVQLYLFVKFSNALLQFTREDTSYSAKYELTANVHSGQNRYITGKMKKGIVKTRTFQQSLSPHLYTTATIRFRLSPGTYNLSLEMFDLETKHRIREDEKITLNHFFMHSLSNSKPIFSHRQIQDENADVAFPEFPPIRFQKDTSFMVYFQIYSTDIPQMIQIEYKISDYQKQPVYSDSMTKNINSRITPICIPLNQHLTFGQYTLTLHVNGSKKIEIESPFYVQWDAHSIYIHNLKQAIETLQYVIKQSEWQYLKSLPQHEQIKVLDTFWKKRDPDPETDENELEEEYYKRIDFTNTHFSNRSGEKEGWKTDRGKIYIIYGAPSEVKEIPFSSSQSGNYEIWYYPNLSKKFIFSDQSGTGHYQLISEE